MPYFRPTPLRAALLAAFVCAPAHLLAADEIMIEDADTGGEIMIDGGDAPGLGGDISIDGGDSAAPGDGFGIDSGGDVMIGDDASGGDAMAADSDDRGDFTIGLDEARLEYGHFPDSASASDSAAYGHVAASANWQPEPRWELQLAGRLDGYTEDSTDSFKDVRGDYGDSYVRYRGDTTTLTLGTQTVIWGRIDELPLSDRVSTADLTRLVLDDLEDRRRSNPMLRAETFVAGGKLDLVWLIDFRAAELPERDSVWYPINRRDGRLVGIDPDDVNPALVRNARIIDDEPDGDGGFGARYTRTHSFADIGLTVARTRQSIPYFRAAGPGVFEAEYPRSWAVGGDAAINAAGATWRVEMLYSSDNPVTRNDATFSYTTVPALQWGAGVEMHPGDGDTRVNLQVVGMNLIDAPRILDRKQVYSFNGEIEMPFDRERWRAKLDFYAGLDEKDIYLNPEIAFLGWEPHELYLAGHYFDGSDQTLGGFYEDQSMVSVGWRAKF